MSVTTIGWQHAGLEGGSDYQGPWRWWGAASLLISSLARNFRFSTFGPKSGGPAFCPVRVSPALLRASACPLGGPGREGCALSPVPALPTEFTARGPQHGPLGARPELPGATSHFVLLPVSPVSSCPPHSLQISLSELSTPPLPLCSSEGPRKCLGCKRPLPATPPQHPALPALSPPPRSYVPIPLHFFFDPTLLSCQGL